MTISCEQDLAWNVLSSRERDNECLFLICTALCLYAASKSGSPHKAVLRGSRPVGGSLLLGLLVYPFILYFYVCNERELLVMMGSRQRISESQSRGPALLVC